MKNAINELIVSTIIIAILAACPIGAHAAQLGVNYYHESMITQQWGVPYIPRTISQVGQDFDEMKTIANNVKFYMNPLVDANLPWILQINQVARSKGMHTVVNMMVDDRQLDNTNWQQYSSKVIAACQQLSGKTDELLVGNEITLHSALARTDIKNKVVALMDQCDTVFQGTVSYEEFWYAKDVWYGYAARPLYWMQYEDLSSFQANIQEMDARWGSNAIVGEWGEDLLDGSIQKDDWWQKDQIQQRWDMIQKTKTPIAYIFTWKEPDWNAFGIVRPDGIHRPLWYVFNNTGAQPSPSPSPPPPAPAPSPSSNPLIAPIASCTIQGGTCTKSTDNADSSCRYVTFNTNFGNVQMTACIKPGGIEIYRNAYPAGRTFSACFDTSCISQNTGFMLYTNSTPPSPPPAQQCVPSNEVCDGKDNNCNGLIDENNVCAPAQSTWSMSTLARSCTANSVACGVQSDTTSGACRTITFTTANGNIQIQGCDKGSGYVEMYRQVAPQGILFSACLDSGCVNKDGGFVRFQPTGTTPAPTPSPTPLPAPNTTGINVASLNPTVTPTGAKVSDIMESSSCRRVQFAPPQGLVDARICPKGDHYEMYLLSTPNGANICVSANCVGSSSGFVSFT